MLALLALPVVALALASSPAELAEGARHPLFLPALGLTARTHRGEPGGRAGGRHPAGVVARGLLRPLGARASNSWWTCPSCCHPPCSASRSSRPSRRNGLLGGPLEALGLQVPFTTAAVVLTHRWWSPPRSTSSRLRPPSAASTATCSSSRAPWDGRRRGRSRGGGAGGAARLVSGGRAGMGARDRGVRGDPALRGQPAGPDADRPPRHLHRPRVGRAGSGRALSLVLAAAAVLLLLGLRALPGGRLGRVVVAVAAGAGRR